MKITILPQGTMAIYEQIVNQLKNAIVTGELKAGEALPSILVSPEFVYIRLRLFRVGLGRV